jgi:hypothetical protein
VVLESGLKRYWAGKAEDARKQATEKFNMDVYYTPLKMEDRNRLLEASHVIYGDGHVRMRVKEMYVLLSEKSSDAGAGDRPDILKAYMWAERAYGGPYRQMVSMLDRIEAAMTFGNRTGQETVDLSNLRNAVVAIIDEEVIARGMTMLRALYGIEDKVKGAPAIIERNVAVGDKRFAGFDNSGDTKTDSY